jgi:hypothetical protein
VRQELARIRDERLEQPVLGRREVHRLPAAADELPTQVHLEVGEPEDRPAAFPLGPAPNRAHPREQLGHAERLRHVRRLLLFEPGVVVTSVPTHLRGAPRAVETV